MDIKRFKELPLMGILRGVRPVETAPLAEAVARSGLNAIEITMNTKGAAAIIADMKKSLNGRAMIGAGTVLSMDHLRSAVDSGASFIVTPVFIDDVVSYCVKHSIPVFPGALTPSEIYRAWRAGAAMVKVFPSTSFGPEYFSRIKGPFGDIELLACGGVSPESIPAFFKNGASAFAFGASVFRREWLEKGDYASVTSAIEALIGSCASCGAAQGR